MNSDQTPEMSRPTKTQMTQQKEVKMEVEDASCDAEDQVVASTSHIERRKAARPGQDIDSHVDKCREVISNLKKAFDNDSLRSIPRVMAWREEIDELEKKLDFPQTIIAVVGNTGAGKSSLINALLDHHSVLPTSGMRACTAVAVKVESNPSNGNFEAYIEFLKKEEWYHELQALLHDLTGPNSKLEKNEPDSNYESFGSYCKVWAVYGKIDTFEVLSHENTVTDWLGKTQKVEATGPEEFRSKVEHYIETQDRGSGGQYWPIVKCVSLKLPGCDVCSSGAALVDLPGVRDSVAARDKVAKEYLKSCSAVWVVSSIHRAVDDKTAKDLLGKSFRRQLLMDGLYGSLAFICTKTDDLTLSELIKHLKLQDKVKAHEDKITELKEEKNDLNRTITRCDRERQRIMMNIKTLRQEKEKLNDNLVKSKEKQAEIDAAEIRINALREQELEATQKILDMESEVAVQRRAIASICAKARNEYSMHEIRRDFKAGLREMKRTADMLNDEDEEEEEDSDDDVIGSTADNLRVFCCSSTEYKKLKDPHTNDGPAQVFSSQEDTGIPLLRHYVHEVTGVRRQQALERLVRSLGRFVFDLQSYTSTGKQLKHKGDRMGTKAMIEFQVQKLNEALDPVLKQLQTDIGKVFEGSIQPKMQEGASCASAEANNTCAKWGTPVSCGGLHPRTYQAAVRRQGVFKSPLKGLIDMNEELSEPMYRSIAWVWDKAFRDKMLHILEKIKEQISGQLLDFVGQLCTQLEQMKIPRDMSDAVANQLQCSVDSKLKEMVIYLRELITESQRSVSRMVTLTVQEGLTPTYKNSAMECGPGANKRIKTHMTQGIDEHRCTMFDEAANKLMQALEDLQSEIQNDVKHVCQTLMDDLMAAFEPLWDTATNSSLLEINVNAACARVRKIYSLAGLENTEEKTPEQTGAD